MSVFNMAFFGFFILRQVFEIWWPASFASLGHDGVDQRFRAYPVAYQSAAENLVGVPR